MADNALLLERIRRRTRLHPQLLQDVERAVLQEGRPPEDVLIDVGFDASDVERLLGDPEPTRPTRLPTLSAMEQRPDDQTLTDEGLARPATAIVRLDEPTVDDLVARLIDMTPRYEIQEEIARGAMGRILAAWDLHLGRPVAMKVLRKSTLRDLDRVRFLEEAQVTGQLQHPSIVPVYELGRVHDQIAFVMPASMARASRTSSPHSDAVTLPSRNRSAVFACSTSSISSASRSPLPIRAASSTATSSRRT